jgi:LmbE family N-acetylglucosaminyl deacetylase
VAAARSALIISPHPDDETLGCGATVALKLAAGHAVTVLMLTDGRHSHRSATLPAPELGALRRAELAEAMRRLGLPDGALRWAGLVDGSVSDGEEELVGLIRSMIEELQPDEVYVTCAEEPHPDHAAAGRAARRATAGGAVQLLEYPVWLWGSWPMRRHDRLRSTLDAARLGARRGAVVVRAGDHLTTKQFALRAYESQLRRPAQVPADEVWHGLPAGVLRAAAEPVELFLPAPQAVAGGSR